jgi:hypothetical protein
MLIRYNTESASPSYDSSWMCPSGLLNPTKDNNDDHYIPDLPSPMPLPRAKVATVQRHPISTMFHQRSSLHLQDEYTDHSHQQPINEYHEDFRYNVPFQERFHQQKITRGQEL